MVNVPYRSDVGFRLLGQGFGFAAHFFVHDYFELVKIK
jgi:hypothetical protein